MNKEKNKLGMGLGALLNTNNKNKNTTNKIDISKIYPNKKQPRKNFEEKEIKELSESIKNQGLIQPIIVRETSSNVYEIIAGERRWRACQLAGLHSVNCVVMSVDDKDVYELALIENIQRENLNVVEEAKAYKQIIVKNRLKTEDLAKQLGKSPSHISNLIRILELDEEIHNMIISGKISMGHARALIGVPDAVTKAREIFEKTGYPLVIKPIIGSWGRSVFPIKDKDTADAVIENREVTDGPQDRIYYLQEMVDRPPRDIRVITVGDQAIAAMYRKSSGGFKTNIALGAEPEMCDITNEIEDLCAKTSKAVGGGILGIDLMEDSSKGLVVHEVNNTVEFKGLVKVAKKNIPKEMIDFAINYIKR